MATLNRDASHGIPLRQPASTAASARVSPRRAWQMFDMVCLVVFSCLVIGGSVITSHGTYLLYSLFLPESYAFASTFLITAAIPFLGLAATLEQTSRRWWYIALMVTILLIELFAQYYVAQSTFVAQVLKRYPIASGVDLATFAQQPKGRLLVVLFQAVFSGLTLAFDFAASDRFKRILDATTRARMHAHDVDQRVSELQAKLDRASQELDHVRHYASDMQQQFAGASARESALLEREAMLTQEVEQLRQASPMIAQSDALSVGKYVVPSLRKLADVLGQPEANVRRAVRKLAGAESLELIEE